VLVACIVGMVILYQSLATQALRHLPQCAVLGYTDRYLADVVLRAAGMMSAFTFAPAVLFASD